jgi:multiple sugar transport system permease protein
MRTGMIDHGQAWLGQSSTALPVIILGTAWQEFPFVMVMLLAALQSVPEELKDAARVDGAGSFGVFRHVTLPAIRNVGVVVTLVLVIWNMQSFALIDLLTQGGPANTTTTLAVFLYDLGFRSFNIGQATAASSLLVLALIAFSTIYVRVLGDRA